MRSKLLKSILIVITIMALTAGNFLFVGQNIVEAIYEELETQSTATNRKEVSFDAYFKSEDKIAHSKKTDIWNEQTGSNETGDILYLKFKLNNSGMLNDAKISFENANFILKDTQTAKGISDNNNSLIKEIKDGQIYLNSITVTNEIEIAIPIMWEKSDLVDANYFDRETKVNLNAKYQNVSEKQYDIDAQKTVRMMWTAQGSLKIYQEPEVFKTIGSGENKKYILQEAIWIGMKGLSTPIKTSELEVDVPYIENVGPENISVICNGKTIPDENITIDEETRKAKITYNNVENSQGKINWENLSLFKVIYQYPSDIDTPKLEMALETKATNTYYSTQEQVTTSRVSQQVVEENTLERNTINFETRDLFEMQDDNVTIKSEEQSVYKGYLYEGSENATAYNENYKVEVSSTLDVSSIEIEKQEEYFMNSATTEKYSINNSTFYTQTKINKTEMQNVLGEAGIIEFYNETEKLGQFDSNTQTDENGDMTIRYSSNVNNLKVVTTKPEKIGTIEIKNEKAISGKTGYSREQLKQMDSIQTTIKLTAKGNSKQETYITKALSLKDTKSEATIQISNSNLSSIQKNENVQIVATLLTNGNQYDLYRNPTIQILLPEQIDTIDVKSITPMNSELNNLIIENGKMEKTQTGAILITITLKGDQTRFGNDINEGLRVIINADITMKKDIPSSVGQIEMTYSNEKSNTTQKISIPVNIVSKYGMVVRNELNVQDAGNVEVYNSEEKEITVGTTEEKVLDGQIAIVNNYQGVAQNVTIKGNLETNEQLTVKDITSSIPNSQITYGEDGKSYEIKLPSNTIEPSQVIKVGYKLSVPQGITSDIVSNALLDYTVDGKQNQENTKINILAKDTNVTQESQENNQNTENNNDNITVETPTNEEPQVETNNEGLVTAIQATTGGQNLTEDMTVKEGQNIKYKVTITNKTGKDLTNVKIKSSQTNAVLYDLVEEERINWDNIVNGQVEKLKEKVYKELDTGDKEYDTIQSLRNGETATIEYQVVTKEIEDKDATTVGTITIQADDLQEQQIKTLENKIEDAEIKMNIKYYYSESIKVGTGDLLLSNLSITNTTDALLKNVELEIKVSDGLEFESSKNIDYDDTKIEIISVDKNIAKFRIKELAAKETTTMLISPYIHYLEDVENKAVAVMATAKTQSESEYVSNVFEKQINETKNSIEISQDATIASGNTIKHNDKITFTINVKNASSQERDVTIIDDIPMGLEINKAVMTKNNAEQDITESVQENSLNLFENLVAEEIVTIKVDATVNTAKIATEEVSNVVEAQIGGNILKSNEITYNVDLAEDQEIIDPEDPDKPIDPTDPEKPIDPTDPTDPTDPENPTNPTDPENPQNPTEEQKTYVIRGTAWVDENKNGTKESSEARLEGIEVRLVDENGDFVKNSDGNIISTKTGSDGVYEIKVPNGNYTLVFIYDTEKYGITEYQKENVEEAKNSDAIINKEMQIDGNTRTVALTDTLKVNNQGFDNIDIGLTERKIFDLSLEKYVSKITVVNKQGTKEYEYDKEDLAKVEIHSKLYAGSTILIEYKIAIKNEGELEGYVNDIVDYIPTGYKFSSEVNSDWYSAADGNLHNTSLSNTKIAEGETKEVSLVLSKTLTEKDQAVVTNTAEIAQSSNDAGVQDQDSTAGNRKEGEDDQSTVRSIISVSTGEATIGIIAIIVTIIILSIFAFIITRKKGGELGNAKINK